MPAAPPRAARSVPVGAVRRLGQHALLVGVPDARAARTLVDAVHAAAWPGVVEVVGGLATVMVAFDADADPEARAPGLAELRAEPRADADRSERATSGKEVRVPCVFDGPDLAEVAGQAGCRADQVAALVTGSVLTVAVVGFSPGFAYLEGLPDALANVPRRDRPRPVVPAGSVALANGHAAVYPSASPGGWHLVGRTAEPFFDAATPPYARLAPGDRVRFTLGEVAGPVPPLGGPAAPDPDPDPGDPVFAVEQPGLRTLRQDGGRRGLAAVGVPAAGPADPASFELANRLVGNAPEACALEVTAKGPLLRCLRPTFVAVVGARPDVLVGGRPARAGQVLPMAAGQRLGVGLVRGGLRCYVAVAGGFTGPGVLGSRATDLLSGLGPGPLAAGELLGAGVVTPPLGDHVDTEQPAGPDEPVTLRVVPGPHPERFDPEAFGALADRRFTVETGNRIGLRLRPGAGPGAPLLAQDGDRAELDSQGTVTGAVQVPPDGQPVVLLPDHATLGGYPVLAVVASVDHGRLGQLGSGATVLLQPVTFAEAAEAWVVQRRILDRAVIGHYPLAVE